MKKWTKKRKEEILKLLTDEIKNSKISILVSFYKLSVLEMQKIREKIKECEGNIMVVKNNLIEIIFKNLSKDEACKFINGPTFVVWSKKENEVDIIKSLLSFQKETEKIKISGCLLNGVSIEKEKVEEIGNLPSKRELQAKLVYLIKMPNIRLINILKSPIKKIVNILYQVKNKKEN